jgi:hypothetical protein
MLVARRLAGLSALEGHYAGVRGRAQCGRTRQPIAASPQDTPRNHAPLANPKDGVLATSPSAAPAADVANGMNWQHFGSR